MKFGLRKFSPNIGVDEIVKDNNTKPAKRMKQQEDNKVIWVVGVVILVFFLLIFVSNLTNSKKKLDIEKNEYAMITEGRKTIKNEFEENNYTLQYINEFLIYTDKKSFVEAETIKKFKEMMKWCSEETIYNELFSKELKEKISLKKFENYKLNSFGIEGISAMVLADDSIYISFIDSANGGAYGVKVKDKTIIEFKKI